MTVVVSAPAYIQRQRVLARTGMTAEKFASILDRQMADDEKCARADYVLETGLGRGATMHDLKKILADIRRLHGLKDFCYA